MKNIKKKKTSAPAKKFCVHCGKQVEASWAFCASCGGATASGSQLAKKPSKSTAKKSTKPVAKKNPQLKPPKPVQIKIPEPWDYSGVSRFLTQRKLLVWQNNTNVGSDDSYLFILTASRQQELSANDDDSCIYCETDFEEIKRLSDSRSRWGVIWDGNSYSGTTCLPCLIDNLDDLSSDAVDANALQVAPPLSSHDGLNSAQYLEFLPPATIWKRLDWPADVDAYRWVLIRSIRSGSFVSFCRIEEEKFIGNASRTCWSCSEAVTVGPTSPAWRFGSVAGELFHTQCLSRFGDELAVVDTSFGQELRRFKRT